MADTPDRIWAEEIGTATKGGQRFRIGRWITDETASHPHEYIRADVARADANLAVAEAIRRAADACVDLADQVSDAALTGLPEQARLRESMAAAFTKASHIILALAPADALAEVQRLREERDRFEAALGRACQVGGTAYLVERAEKAEAERDAALARVEKLRHQITEASDPDFIWGALDNVHDAETTLDDYAAAVSRAIRGAMQIKGDDA